MSGALLCTVSLLGAGGCHIISSPDQSSLELTENSTHQKAPKKRLKTSQCSHHKLVPSRDRSIFSAWWEGQWELDTPALSRQLAQELGGDPESIGASLAQAFSLRVQAQQAELLIDERRFRLATTPLKDQRGARLVGAQREVFIWCEGERAYWRLESGDRFPLRRVIAQR